jgi:Rrf2 family transcriptional regulator, iron-sulfur cluster assembly transcription factor
MKLTTRGRYAVIALVDLAQHESKGPVGLADIASRQGLSQSYLEQLFAALRRRKLVKSVRGPGGGYYLNSPAEAVSVAAIMQAIDEPVDTTKCQGEANCQAGDRCATHHLWIGLNKVIFDYLDQVSLASLTERKLIFHQTAKKEGETV